MKFDFVWCLRSCAAGLFAAVAPLTVCLAEFTCDPSNKSLQAWLETEKNDEKIEIQHVSPIRLTGKEEACLYGVSFPFRTRNAWEGYILSRPSLKKARELKEFGGQASDFTIVEEATAPFGPSAVILDSAGSGQGTTLGKHTLAYFDGWMPKTLHEATFSENFGTCGEDLGECKSVDVFLNALAGPKNTEFTLVETTVTLTGPNDSSLKSEARATVKTIPRLVPSSDGKK